MFFVVLKHTCKQDISIKITMKQMMTSTEILISKDGSMNGLVTYLMHHSLHRWNCLAQIELSE